MSDSEATPPNVDEAGDEGNLMVEERAPKPVDATDSKKAIVRGIRGTVQWFSFRNHYGFINRQDTGEDVFVHVSGILYGGHIRYALDEKLEVEMDVSVGLKGPEATAVTLPGGYPIKSEKILFYRRRHIKKAKSDEKDGIVKKIDPKAAVEKKSVRAVHRRQHHVRNESGNKKGQEETSSGDTEIDKKVQYDEPEKDNVDDGL